MLARASHAARRLQCASRASHPPPSAPPPPNAPTPDLAAGNRSLEDVEGDRFRIVAAMQAMTAHDSPDPRSAGGSRTGVLTPKTSRRPRLGRRTPPRPPRRPTKRRRSQKRQALLFQKRQFVLFQKREALLFQSLAASSRDNGHFLVVIAASAIDASIELAADRRCCCSVGLSRECCRSQASGALDRRRPHGRPFGAVCI